MEVSAIYLMEGCNDKLDCYNDRTTCEVLSLNETVETPATSTCLSVTCLDINKGHSRHGTEQTPEYRISRE
jgi:hypothetical protein